MEEMKTVTDLSVADHGKLIEVNGFKGVFLGATVYGVEPPYVALTLQGSDPDPVVTWVRLTAPVKVVC